MRISLIWGPKRFLLSPWVETSCRNFLPSLLPLVSTLPVIYARSIFEQQGPWLIKTLFSRSLLTTVCSLAAGVDVARSPSRREPMAHSEFSLLSSARGSSPLSRLAMPGMYAANGQRAPKHRFYPMLVTSSRFRNRLGNINAKIAAQRVEETSPQKWKEA